MPLFLIVSEILAHPVETPWPSRRFYTRICAGLYRTYWTTFGIAEKNINGSCPMREWDHPLIFWVFNSPSPHLPGADGHHRGRGHVGRHWPYTNNIWCGSVQALPRYRSKTAKMQKFPIDSHSNENFISPFFRPPGAANPQKGRSHIRNQSTPACKIWCELACGLSRNHWQKNEQNSKSKTNTSPFALTSEWRVIICVKQSRHHFKASVFLLTLYTETVVGSLGGHVWVWPWCWWISCSWQCGAAPPTKHVTTAVVVPITMLHTEPMW